MRLARMVAAFLLVSFLSACAEPGTKSVSAEVAEFCRPSSTALAEPLDPASPRDAAVATRFGEVCNLSRMKGLRFDTDAAAYECRLSLLRFDHAFFEEQGEEYQRRRIEEEQGSPYFDEAEFRAMMKKERTKARNLHDKLRDAFGFPVALRSFHPAATNADDLIEGQYARDREKQGFGLPLAILAFYQSVGVSVILLTDDGASFDYVLSREDFDERFREVESLAGAANLLYLKKELGFVIDEAPDKRAVSLCEAGDATAEAEGWTFEGVNLAENCGLGEIRDIRVTRSGEIDAVTTGTTNPGICYD
ncbi:hypothetical protein [Parvibaculum sp.]|jgi:hypothetical protein|uniref:hypothetical protein n=1 Tax=Parvibaculum sp. TaxID=2024848 RepID=UPI00329755F1